MKRVVLIGATGSGKTTLGRTLSARLHIPFTDLDDLFWLPGWQQRPEEEFRRLAAEALPENGAWIVAGNYGGLRDLVWGRADTVVWLDYGFALTFFRLLKRSIARVLSRETFCNGNRETVGKLLSGDGIISWLFQTYRRRKKDFGEAFENPAARPYITWVRLTTPDDTRKWLETLS